MNKRNSLIISSALLIAIVFMIVSCATSPTGRSQLVLVPDSQLSAMGKSSFEDMKKHVTIETDPKMNEYVRCVAHPIVMQVAENEADANTWEIVVFRDKQVNAFALPGKKIGVYTGILPIANTGAQLGAVLGHEVGHVLARHGNERVSQAFVVQGGLVAASLALNDQKGPKFQLMMAALGLGAQFGILLPFSRAHESEADLIGLKLMAQAGFDPTQAIELWKNMSKAGGGAPPQWMSTHPSNETRIESLQSHLPDVLPIYEKVDPSKRPQCKL